MEFDSFTVVLLQRRTEYVDPGDAAAETLQDAHLAYLSSLHDRGLLLAAGPLDHPDYRGMSLVRGDADTARELAEADPAVEAGVYAPVVMPWRVPAGAARFERIRFPRSVAEVLG